MKFKSQKYNLGIIILLVVLFLWGLNWLGALKGLINNETGEAFGLVNALFAGLAFAGIIFTIHLQKQELQLQRAELKATREEFKTQNETFKLQRFENTFFQMVNLHHEIIEKRGYISSGSNRLSDKLTEKVKHNNTSIFEDLLSEDKKMNETNSISEEIKKEQLIILEAYKELYDDGILRRFNHYFRHLYHLVKFIHLHKGINLEEKKFYTILFRAQLSDDELYLIFYNSLLEEYGYPNLLYLVKEYDILKNLNFENRITNKRHIELYEKLKSEVKNPFV